MRRGLGWLPDLQRSAAARPDWTFAAQVARLSNPPTCPQAHSNRGLVVDVLDQGPLNACVPCAGFQAVRMAQLRQGATTPLLGARLFGYYLARATLGLARFDSGTNFRAFFWVLNQYGFLPERDYLWGYDITQFAQAPPTAAYQMAYDLRSPTRYWAIEDGPARVEQVRQAVAMGYGVCIGLMVDQDFMDWRIDPSAPLDPPRMGLMLGHAMLVEGYDGDKFTILNSWGAGFGDDGRCLVSADYLTEACAMWVVEQAPRAPRSTRRSA